MAIAAIELSCCWLESWFIIVQRRIYIETLTARRYCSSIKNYFFPDFDGLFFTGSLAGLVCGIGRGVSECFCSTFGNDVFFLESLLIILPLELNV